VYFSRASASGSSFRDPPTDLRISAAIFITMERDVSNLQAGETNVLRVKVTHKQTAPQLGLLVPGGTERTVY
jgi:hypothetical protein